VSGAVNFGRSGKTLLWCSRGSPGGFESPGEWSQFASRCWNVRGKPPRQPFLGIETDVHTSVVTLRGRPATRGETEMGGGGVSVCVARDGFGGSFVTRCVGREESQKREFGKKVRVARIPAGGRRRGGPLAGQTSPDGLAGRPTPAKGPAKLRCPAKFGVTPEGPSNGDGSSAT